MKAETERTIERVRALEPGGPPYFLAGETKQAAVLKTTVSRVRKEITGSIFTVKVFRNGAAAWRLIPPCL